METLIRLFALSHDYARLLVADIPDADFARQPHPGMNHPAWVLGHLIVVADMAAQLLGEPMVTDQQWMATYGPGSTPSEHREHYASKQQLLEMMDQTYARLSGLAAIAAPEVLAAPNNTPFMAKSLPAMGDLLAHVLSTHATMHLGQLSAWRRTMGKGSVLGI